MLILQKSIKLEYEYVNIKIWIKLGVLNIKLSIKLEYV